MFENLEGRKLVGILHKPGVETDKIIIFAHGSSSNKDRLSLIKIAEELSEEYSFLRFDFGGSGESYDCDIEIGSQVSDLKGAIRFAKARGYSDICLMGASLGGLISVLCYSPEIKVMILLAPLTTSKVPTDLKTDEKLKILGEKGFIERVKDGKVFRFSKKYFDYRGKINQKELLSGVGVPVLIIHGDADDTVSLDDSKEAMKYLPNGSELEIIKGGGHKLGPSDGVIKFSKSWLERHFD